MTQKVEPVAEFSPCAPSVQLGLSSPISQPHVPVCGFSNTPLVPFWLCCAFVALHKGLRVCLACSIGKASVGIALWQVWDTCSVVWCEGLGSSE